MKYISDSCQIYVPNSEVTTCSKSCNRKRKETNRQLNKTIHDSSNVEDPFVAIRENINIGCTESSIDDKEQLLNNMDSVLESVLIVKINYWTQYAVTC